MTFKEWVKLFHESDTTVEVDWDSGHAYHIMNNTPDPELCDDPDSADDYQNDYMCEHGPALFCVPDLINELTGKFSVCSCECYDNCDSPDKIEHIEGFIELAEEMKCAEWYHTDKLRSWLFIQRVNKSILLKRIQEQ